MSSWVSKISSVHTYVMPRTVYFGLICRSLKTRAFDTFFVFLAILPVSWSGMIWSKISLSSWSFLSLKKQPRIEAVQRQRKCNIWNCHAFSITGWARKKARQFQNLHWLCLSWFVLLLPVLYHKERIYNLKVTFFYSTLLKICRKWLNSLKRLILCRNFIQKSIKYGFSGILNVVISGYKLFVR